MSIAASIMSSHLGADPKQGAEHAEHVERVALKATTDVAVPKTTYKIAEQWHSQPKHLRVIHVGAGAAGLLMAYKMQKDFQNYGLVCYEKNPDVGGTWYENRYPGKYSGTSEWANKTDHCPGCACDV